jgi:hypothetical protein
MLLGDVPKQVSSYFRFKSEWLVEFKAFCMGCGFDSSGSG